MQLLSKIEKAAIIRFSASSLILSKMSNFTLVELEGLQEMRPRMREDLKGLILVEKST